MRTIDLQGDLELNDGTYQVTGRLGDRFSLVNLATANCITLHLAELHERLVHVPQLREIPTHTVENLPPDDQAEVQFWVDHLEEMTTGIHPNFTTPRPQYDPTLSVNARVASKVEELRALGRPASRASLMAKKKRYLEAGPGGLLDGRKAKKVTPFDRTDARVVNAMASVIQRMTNESTRTANRTFELTRAEVLRLFRDDSMMPSRATLYRHYKALTKGKYTDGLATNRRSAANAPQRTFGQQRLLFPGEEVQVDSTRMDVLVRTPDGPQRPTLTVMVDVATRSIIASTILLEAAKSYDHALLLRQALLSPANRRMSEEKGVHRALVRARLKGEHRLLDDSVRADLDAQRPTIVPRRIVIDNGADYLGGAFLTACRKWEIDVTQSAIHTPTDKAVIERTLGAIRTMFTEKLPGYVGNSPSHKGYRVEDQDLLDPAGLKELFDDWVASVWQRRPHASLRHPGDPSFKYTPNQWYAATVEFAGNPVIPMSDDDAIDMLPSTYRVIGREGVQHGNRQYDSPELHPLRGTRSNLPSKSYKWEVKIHPYNIDHVWVRGFDGTFIECTWRKSSYVDAPHFADVLGNLDAIRNGSTTEPVSERDRHAREQAALAGVPMPTGTTDPDEVDPVDFDLTNLDDFDLDDVEGYDLFNPHED